MALVSCEGCFHVKPSPETWSATAPLPLFVVRAMKRFSVNSTDATVDDFSLGIATSKGPSARARSPLSVP